ncbi:MAG: Uncharacterised protein [Cryomorphaceae bacterium]|nr:MAG: Uncharacterised protein [Cryomorphaceae bacterium]
MGSKFALWDWMLGTLVLSKSVGRISFGADKDNSKFDSLFKNLFNPFKAIAYSIISKIKKNKSIT